MDANLIIEKNCVSSDNYDDMSFVGVLHEKGIWSREQYWFLEWALCELISKNEFRFEKYGPIFIIFSYIVNSIASNYDQNDFFEIKNLKEEEIFEFRERVRVIFESYFSGRLPERVMFEEVNPLLPDGIFGG